MPLYKYTANVDSSEGTGRILLAADENGLARALELGGAPVELTDSEYAQLSGRYVLESLDQEAAVADEEPDEKSPTTSSQTTSSSPSPLVSPTTLGASGSTSTPASGN